MFLPLPLTLTSINVLACQCNLSSKILDSYLSGSDKYHTPLAPQNVIGTYMIPSYTHTFSLQFILGQYVTKFQIQPSEILSLFLLPLVFLLYNNEPAVTFTRLLPEFDIWRRLKISPAQAVFRKLGLRLLHLLSCFYFENFTFYFNKCICMIFHKKFCSSYMSRGLFVKVPVVYLANSRSQLS